MDKTKAAMRALREACGYTQGDIAEVFSVTTTSVKRWERPGNGYEVPDDVFGWLEVEYDRMRHFVSMMVGDTVAKAGDGAFVLRYYRTQEELEAAGVSDNVHFVNAATREAARILTEGGIAVGFEYAVAEDES